MLHIVLFEPEIPQNTGNIGRTCALTQARLHLIYPLGFEIKDKHLKRSGMDYWKSLDVHHHENWEAFKNSDVGPKRLFLFSTKSTKAYWDIKYEEGDGLLFGRESAGVPDWLHEEIGEELRLTIPQFNSKLRSLNLATAAAVAVFEAMRQLHAE